MSQDANSGERQFRGIPVSAGVCRGKVFVLSRPQDTPVPHYAISESQIAEETNRLEQALLLTRNQILEIQGRVQDGMGSSEAQIFEAHLMVLEDPVVLQEVIRHVERDRVNVDYAFATVSAKYITALEAAEDDFLRERVSDMRDVATRVLHNLLGREHGGEFSQPKEPCILVAYDLTPSRTALLDKKLVLGFATDQGSKTSHTAILARSLQIPAVTGLVDASQQLVTGQPVLLDGYSGMLVLHPTEQTLYEYGQVERKQLALRDLLVEVHDQPAATLDGKRIILSANAENLEEAPAILANGAEGIGLFRTEYLFLKRDSLPTEEEQYQAYSQMANALKPQPVIIRTLDLGGDKAIACLGVESERNPFLGWRAIRICLQETDLFRGQLRAILRASVSGNIKMMYPMISGVDELLQANALLEQCKQELRLQGVPFDEKLEVGVMIEVPAAAMMADHLAKRVSFFSVGTNDLVQYSLAVDRMNPKIAHLYEPTHPSILRLIKHTVDAAHANGIWIGVCGEMASDPVLIPILIGLGVDELSTAVPLIPAAKYMIRRLNSVAAKELADFAVNCESGAEVLARADAFARSIAPALFQDMKQPT